MGWTHIGRSLVSDHLNEQCKAWVVTSAANGQANQYRLSNPDLDKLALLVGGFEASRILRSRETVGWVRPSDLVRSQAQASPALVRGDHRDQPQTSRIGQGLEQPGEAGGLAGR